MAMMAPALLVVFRAAHGFVGRVHARETLGDDEDAQGRRERRPTVTYALPDRAKAHARRCKSRQRDARAA